MSLHWTSRGNYIPPLEYLCTSSPDCITICQPDAHRVTIDIEPTECGPDGLQIVNCKVLNRETCEILFEYTSVVEVLPLCPEKITECTRFPSWMELFVAHEHGDTIFGIDVYGSGMIDEESGLWANYELCLPTKEQSGIYNEKQILHLQIGQERWDLQLGDGIYCLSPLTERYRYARGVQGSARSGNWETGGLYLSNMYACAEQAQEAGGYMLWRPTECALVAYNFLHKNRTLSIQKLTSTASKSCGHRCADCAPKVKWHAILAPITATMENLPTA